MKLQKWFTKKKCEQSKTILNGRYIKVAFISRIYRQTKLLQVVVSKGSMQFIRAISRFSYPIWIKRDERHEKNRRIMRRWTRCWHRKHVDVAWFYGQRAAPTRYNVVGRRSSCSYAGVSEEEGQFDIMNFRASTALLPLRRSFSSSPSPRGWPYLSWPSLPLCPHCCSCLCSRIFCNGDKLSIIVRDCTIRDISTFDHSK